MNVSGIVVVIVSSSADVAWFVCWLAGLFARCSVDLWRQGKLEEKEEAKREKGDQQHGLILHVTNTLQTKLI